MQKIVRRNIQKKTQSVTSLKEKDWNAIRSYHLLSRVQLFVTP